MVNGWFIWILKSRFFLILPFLFCSCIVDNKNKEEHPNVILKNELKSGDIVLRLGNGYFSDIFRSYASKEKKYSHVGVISIEDGITYVYHAEASELTGVGRVKKEVLESFLKEIAIFDFYRLEQLDTVKIAEFVKYHYKKRTPFDLDFNSDDDSEMYCSELVAKAINSLENNELITPTLLLANRKLYGLDDIYLKLRKLN
ncbi:hypothetical protein JBL43_00970 [Aureibaculum sp. A20]|uniref:YiiX family permuted papain-like enzyme n=1 Tax=Aureibaculum flavum TaxID=2795986 RepID=A0ABS0WLF2_9FLAO|nr:YiiX/YebB-like N1pC/P60 family cysteine hydrolase [Aureibaculum flavum]MBJ2172788.1 hypothetical protein [Aureibaculum flavum]